MGQENQSPEPAEPGLFGWTPRSPRGKGQPPHEPDAKKRNKVRLMLAFGKSNAQIAHALDISEPTLRKHYFFELKRKAMARDAAEADLLVALFDQAQNGNVGAQKQLQAKWDRLDMQARAQAAAGDGDEPEKPMPERPLPKGKKEAARAAAEDLLGANPLLNPNFVN